MLSANLLEVHMIFENLLIVEETKTKKEFGLYYRVAEIDEWIEYSRGRVKIFKEKDEEKQISDIFRLNIDFGERMIEGLREGDFPFSSDPQSATYDPEWRVKLKKRFYYLVTQVVDYAFRGGEVQQKN
jgi:hypothetical protein